jgi:hypothetical protein
MKRSKSTDIQTELCFSDVCSTHTSRSKDPATSLFPSNRSFEDVHWDGADVIQDWSLGCISNVMLLSALSLKDRCRRAISSMGRVTDILDEVIRVLIQSQVPVYTLIMFFWLPPVFDLEIVQPPVPESKDISEKSERSDDRIFERFHNVTRSRFF